MATKIPVKGVQSNVPANNVLLKRSQAAMDTKESIPSKKLRTDDFLCIADDGKQDGQASSSSSPLPSNELDSVVKGDPSVLYQVYGKQLGLGGSGGTLTSGKHKHFYLIGSVSVTDGQAQYAQSINTIPSANGSDAYNLRLSRQVRLHRLHFRAIVSCANDINLATPAQGPGDWLYATPMRIVIFWDKMPVANGPASSPVANITPIAAVDTPSATPTTGGGNAVLNTETAGTTVNCQAAYNYNTMGTRYEIIYDKTFLHGNMTSGGIYNTVDGYMHWSARSQVSL